MAKLVPLGVLALLLIVAPGQAASGSPQQTPSQPTTSGLLDLGLINLGNLVQGTVWVKNSPSDPNPQPFTYSYFTLSGSQDSFNKLLQQPVLTSDSLNGINQYLLLNNGLLGSTLNLLLGLVSPGPSFLYYSWNGQSGYIDATSLNGMDPIATAASVLGISSYSTESTSLSAPSSIDLPLSALSGLLTLVGLGQVNNYTSGGTLVGLLPILDVLPPDTYSDAPAGWVNHDLTVNLTCVDNAGGSGCATTYYSLDGGAQQTGNSVAVAGEGTHTITYHSVDNDSDVEINKTATVQIDQTPPGIGAIVPAPGSTVKTPPADVVVNYSDAGAGILPSSANVYMNGTPMTGCSATVTSISCPVSGLAAGTYTITGSVADNAGNSTPIDASFTYSLLDVGLINLGNLVQGTVWVKNSPSDPNPQPFTYSYFTLSGSQDSFNDLLQQPVLTTDSVNGINQYLLLNDGLLGSTLNLLLGLVSPGPSFLYYSWNGQSGYIDATSLNGMDPIATAASVLGISSYSTENTSLSAPSSIDLPLSALNGLLTLVGLGQVNNYTSGGTLVGLLPILDLFPPNTYSDAPAGWVNHDLTVNLTCVDNAGGSGCATTYYSLDGGAQQAGNSVAVAGEGTHTITYHSVDNNSNVEVDNIATVRIDKTPPGIGAIVPAPGSTVKTPPADVVVNYSDAGAGILSSSANVYMNGTLMTGCSATVTSISCPVSGLAAGTFTITGSVSDNAGNSTPIDASFTYSLARNYYFPWYDNVYGMTWVLMAEQQGGGGNIFDNTLGPTALESGVSVNDNSTLARRYDGVMGGPLLSRARSGPGMVSERSLFGNSFEEVWATQYENLDSHYYWPLYLGNGMSEWVLVSNPAENGEAIQADLTIRTSGTPITASKTIQPGESWTPIYYNQGGYAVEVKTYKVGGNPNSPADARKSIASERVLMGGAFNEMEGIPASKLTSKYMWTWYDNINSLEDMLAVGNPDPANSIWALVYVGGQLKGHFQIGAQGVMAWQNETQLMNGPVEVDGCADNSDPCTSPVDIYASQLTQFGASYEETAGTRVDEMMPTANWTWYDEQTAGALNWVLVANPNQSGIYYEIQMPGVDPATTPGASGTLAAGQRVTPRFPGIMGGPVRVSAWTDASKSTPANVLSSQRVLWNGYFNEVVGKGI